VKIKFFPILILTALVALVGCKPKETTLSGQMFIVTQGADNVKLGDVEILLVEKSQVADFLQKKQTTIEKEITDRKRAVEVAEKEAETAQINYESFLANKPYLTNDDYVKMMGDNGSLLQKYNDLNDKLRSLPATSEEFEKAEKQMAQIQSDVDSLMEKMMRFQNSAKEANARILQTATNNLATAKSKLENSPTAEDYFEGFSPTIAEKRSLTLMENFLLLIHATNRSRFLRARSAWF
jgi:hypothetical protein